MMLPKVCNKQIAYELGVSEATIKAHVSAILRKLRRRPHPGRDCGGEDYQQPPSQHSRPCWRSARSRERVRARIPQTRIRVRDGDGLFPPLPFAGRAISQAARASEAGLTGLLGAGSCLRAAAVQLRYRRHYGSAGGHTGRSGGETGRQGGCRLQAVPELIRRPRTSPVRPRPRSPQIAAWGAGHRHDFGIPGSIRVFMRSKIPASFSDADDREPLTGVLASGVALVTAAV